MLTERAGENILRFADISAGGISMEYVKPFGQFIEFDNSDIIVTSPGAFPSTREQGCPGDSIGAWCSPNADPNAPNNCDRNGRVCSDGLATTAVVVYCYFNPPGSNVCSPENGNFTNSVKPPM